MTYTCILLSLLLMYLVGSLSLVYTRGAALMNEIEQLAAAQPDRRFGQLERQLLVAQDEIFTVGESKLVADAGTGPIDPGDGGQTRIIDDLARESSYVVLHELLDLNKKLKSLENRVGEFQLLADAPLPGTAAATSLGGWIAAKTTNGLAYVFGWELAKAEDQPPAAAGNSYPDGMIFFCKLAVEKRTATAANSQALNAVAIALNPADNTPKTYVLGMDMGTILDQACKYNLSYVSMTVPSVRLWAMQINDKLQNYSSWILPCLYAALGTMIFYMRLILNPNEENPDISRVLHRIALAALAAIVLSWFWEPAFGGNTEFKAAGVGLFTFAFIIGFSIDVFFALLDRLVAISSGAVSKLGQAG